MIGSGLGHDNLGTTGQDAEFLSLRKRVFEKYFVKLHLIKRYSKVQLSQIQWSPKKEGKMTDDRQ